MKKQTRSLWYITALVLFLSLGVALNAQTTPQTQPPDAQAQQPATPDQAQPSQEKSQTPSQAPAEAPREAQDQAGKPASSAQGESAQAAGTQNFTGTVVKSNGKYVFQDEASGNTYDIDHQDELQKFEGKKVKVRGALDANSKMIHVQ
jgi:predicted lipid-binding transport protein (Tim44 family)